MQYFTKTQACALLGTTMPTLNKCIKKLQEQGHDLTVVRDPYNRHLAMLSADHIDVIRAFMGAYRERVVPRALPAPPKTPRLPPAPPTASDLPHSASQGHPSVRDHPNRTYSTKPPLPEGWISFEEARRLTGIAGNWEKSQADRERWATAGPFLRDRATVWWALSPEQQEAFFAHFGRRV